jgi:hypothetical protein
MMRAVTESIALKERNNRRWMIIVFIAGMVFTAALLQTISERSGVFHRPKATLTPAVNDNGGTVDITYYRLVHACPGREALLAT